MLLGTNGSEVKLQNISAILLTLLQQRDVARVGLAEKLGVSTSTVTNLVNELIKLGLVIEEGTVRPEEPVVGRPQRALHLVPDARYALGVHINVGMVYIALTDMCGKPITTKDFSHSVDVPWVEVLDRICTMITEILHSHDRAKIVGVGVAASGLVHQTTGVNVVAPNLKWHNVPIRDYLQERLDLPVAVENNVRAMALGEALFGEARGVYSTAFVYARVGVGAGFVVGGQLFRGAAAGAGEIGHTKIIFQNGATREVKDLEELFSEGAIRTLAKNIIAADPHHPLYGIDPTLGDICAVASEDERIREMLEDRAYHMGLALANLVNIFNPELIVLGGIFLNRPDVFMPMIEATIRENAFADLGQKVRLCLTSFGNDAGMIGAAAVALERYLYRPVDTMAYTR
jgi:predicted NBD/HSP70 family sugar kinase